MGALTVTTGGATTAAWSAEGARRRGPAMTPAAIRPNATSEPAQALTPGLLGHGVGSLRTSISGQMSFMLLSLAYLSIDRFPADTIIPWLRVRQPLSIDRQVI